MCELFLLNFYHPVSLSHICLTRADQENTLLPRSSCSWPDSPPMSPAPPASDGDGCNIDEDPLCLSNADELAMCDILPEFEVGMQFIQDGGPSDERVSPPRDSIATICYNYTHRFTVRSMYAHFLNYTEPKHSRVYTCSTEWCSHGLGGQPVSSIPKHLGTRNISKLSSGCMGACISVLICL